MVKKRLFNSIFFQRGRREESGADEKGEYNNIETFDETTAVSIPSFSRSCTEKITNEDDLKKSYDEIVIAWRNDGSVALYVRKEAMRIRVVKKCKSGRDKIVELLKNIICCGNDCHSDRESTIANTESTTWRNSTNFSIIQTDEEKQLLLALSYSYF
ncbi:4993_t:CDS:2 [Ambispora gerdemannii]|uniref:4993_t:CDS:1 n=1 Tax=Ambispora gerdemannii TaxID=144530 RepID=A0A9N8V7K8_9GLOM|nr:4993_t:CDS:2 [Ambispora gerdemannii]